MQKTWHDGPVVSGSLYDHIVASRQIADVASFIAPRWPDDLHDPFLLPDMARAVSRIWDAIIAGEKVGIVGDYDMDGTPAAALMAQFLRLVGVIPFVILPTRDDGYGFSSAFVTRFQEAGVSLIITVDCGIRDHEAIAAATAAGIDVIITDHHECGDTLPAALAVLNPKRADSTYPFRELCGTGVAFKLIQALIQEAPVAFRARIPESWLAWSLDIVMLATVSDMVPLVDENRLIAIYGMKVLRKTKREGLARFIEAVGLAPEEITYTDIAYKLVPKCNATGRMGSMAPVYALLASTDSHEVRNALQEILVAATQSQLKMQTMLTEAREVAQSQVDQPIIVIADPAWHPGLTGLVASRLVDELQRPVGVFAGVPEEGYRGSFRGGAGVDFPTLLTKVSPLLERFGGHAQAAGVSFPRNNLDALRVALAEQVTATEMLHMTTDGLIMPQHASLMAIEQLEQLAPWGMSHIEPVWSMRNVCLDNVKWLKEQHLKADISANGHTVSGIAFGATKYASLVDAPVDVCGTVSVNVFRGQRSPQFMIKGIAPTAV